MSKLTEWEVSNELCSIADYIADHSAEFHESHPKLHKMLFEMRQKIGDEFERRKTHKFGIVNSGDKWRPKK